jgi:hypothetical protein
VAITSLANGSAFFIAYQGFGICIQKDESGQLTMVETDGKGDGSVESELNSFRKRLLEYVDSAGIELDKLAVVAPLVSLMKRLAEKNGTDAPQEMIKETIQKATEAENLAKRRIAEAKDMMEDVLNFMLDNNIAVQQLDGKKIEDDSASRISDLLSRFKGGDTAQ